MFDISGPVLVFDTHCHGFNNEFTGYIFALYEMEFSKPRELFFSHIAEAQVFALNRGAALFMNPACKPERLAASMYLRAYVDDPNVASMSTNARNMAERRRKKKALKDFPLPVAFADLDGVEDLGTTADINFFGATDD